MISTPKRSVSVWFLVAFWLALLSIGGTIQNNREKAQRRLVEPVQTEGELVSSHCTSFTHGYRGGGLQPYAVLEYKYSTIGQNSTQHVLVTTHWFDTLKDCAVFEKTNSNVATIWYEKEQPEKASLYKTEPDSWVGLYGLIPTALFVLLAVYDQKSINKEKRKSQTKRRDLKRLKRKVKT